MEVRTGKTLTALFTAELFGSRHVLFLTKKKAIGSIEADSEALAVTYRLTITNYEQLQHFSNEGFDLIICDEAHCLGQFPTPAERTKLLKDIAAGLPIIYLSGTPSPESYSQLYHQFWISSYSPFADLTTFYKWAALFVTRKVKYMYNRQINDYSDANKEAIDKVCGHLFISYTQAEAGFTQVVEEEILHVKMRDTTYSLSKKLQRDKIYIGKNGEEILADTAVKLMNKLHQVYSGTVLDEAGNGTVFDRTKAEFIRDRFAGLKIAVFYKFKAEYGMLLWVFAGRIVETPEDFNDGDATRVFISQIQSGREGINLSTADALIFLNIDFSAVSYLQARARMQTKDRIKASRIFWVFAEDGIEDRIYERVSAKEDFTLSYFKSIYEGSRGTKAINKTA